MATERTITGVKVTCLAGVVIQFVFTWTRFALLFYIAHQQRKRDIELFFTLGLYKFWAGLLTMYAPLQIYTLIRELNRDLLWYKHWFKRIYVMYISSFIFYQLGNATWQTFIHLIIPFKQDDVVAQSLRVTVDIVDAVVGITTNMLFIVILFRPLMPNFCFGELTIRSPATVSYTQFTSGSYPDGHLDGEIHMSDGDMDPEDRTCCNKKVALGFAIFFFVLYFAGIVSALAFLLDSVYCSTKGTRSWCH